MGITVSRSVLAALLLGTAFMTAGCKSKEEKADDYYQSALDLISQGDHDRASIEFRNVFKNNGFHKEARLTYANMLLEDGNVADAYGQYLRLIEQYPDTIEVRQTLTELAIKANNWEEVERHGTQAIILDPNSTRSRAIKIVMEYRAAALDRDMIRMREIASDAEQELANQPQSEILHRVVIDRAVQDNRDNALDLVDAAIAQFPSNLEFHMFRFRILIDKGDLAATGKQLNQMYERFPDNSEVRAALIGWYLTQNDLDGAEAFMRKLAGAPTENVDEHIALLQLIRTSRGAEAARTEMVSLKDANAGTPLADRYGAMIAVADFEAGKTEEGISAIREILEQADESDQKRDIKANLAIMLDSVGDRLAARTLVDEILENDPSHVTSLKTLARWLVDADKPGDAIIALRTALGQAPRDPAIFTLMALAYERDGSTGLVGDNLALAVEASNAGADESVRYATFLLQQNRISTAEKVLTDSRSTNPGSLDVLTALADVYLRQNKYPQATEVADYLAGSEDPVWQDRGQIAKSAILAAQNRLGENLAALQDQINSGDVSARAVGLLVQSYLQKYDFENARKVVDDALSASPDDVGMLMLSANLYSVAEEHDKAIAIYEDMLAQDPANFLAVQMLYGSLIAIGETAKATEVLDAGLIATNNHNVLAWIKASELELQGDIDGAIAIYEVLYASDSNNLVVANNLASLLTTKKNEPENLERAYAIGRRLRASSVPAFLDTYGWIEHLRGNHSDAIPALETAANGLPEEPLAQFHLGMAYADSGRSQAAIDQLNLFIEKFDEMAIPEIAIAKERVAQLVATSGQ